MDTNSEAWRAECEARWVMRLARPERQAFYALVHEKRGPAAMDRLIEDVKTQWQAQQGRSSSASATAPSYGSLF